MTQHLGTRDIKLRRPISFNYFVCQWQLLIYYKLDSIQSQQYQMPRHLTIMINVDNSIVKETFLVYVSFKLEHQPVSCTFLHRISLDSFQSHIKWQTSEPQSACWVTLTDSHCHSYGYRANKWVSQRKMDRGRKKRKTKEMMIGGIKCKAVWHLELYVTSHHFMARLQH